ncbi:hypothetical protein M1590_03810 [Candidatus Marsarchaeota archaeon]|nr:hypothetical protein [Candidatus Marsarchaeota archaeon]
MKSADFLERLDELEIPVFSLETASSIIQKSKAYTRLYINRLCREGLVKAVERGKYCLPNTDDYTIASRIIPHSYISGYAALEHYKLTTQIPATIQVIAPKYHRPIKLAIYKVKFSKVKKDFVYGYIAATNGPVFAEPEKIFIDDLYLHGRQYYSEEFTFAIERNRINIEKLKRYAILSKNKSLIKSITKDLKSYETDIDITKSEIKLQKRANVYKKN